MAEAAQASINTWIASQPSNSSLRLRLEEFSLDTLSATFSVQISPSAAEADAASSDSPRFSLFFEDTWKAMVRPALI